MIYIGDYDGVLRALDASTGKEAWTFKAEMQIDASPTSIGDNLLVTSEDGTLYCLKRATGELNWKYETVINCVAEPHWRAVERISADAMENCTWWM